MYACQCNQRHVTVLLSMNEKSTMHERGVRIGQLLCLSIAAHDTIPHFLTCIPTNASSCLHPMMICTCHPTTTSTDRLSCLSGMHVLYWPPMYSSRSIHACVVCVYAYEHTWLYATRIVSSIKLMSGFLYSFWMSVILMFVYLHSTCT
jgi:hypothetical protein